MTKKADRKVEVPIGTKYASERGNGVMGTSKTIKCVFEGGVFKPLEKVELEEGARLKIKVERANLSKYYGILGKASAERLEELEEEAQL